MVSRGSADVVLWPRYFDARLSRAQGRRVAKDLAVRDPDAAWVASAARKAGLEPKDEDKLHPARPYGKGGRVLVAKDGSKEALIRMVAEQMQ